MKDVFIIWFALVSTEMKLAVKKISISKRDSSIKSSHRSAVVGPVCGRGGMNAYVCWGSFGVADIF